MAAGMAGIIDSFKDIHVLVVGEAMLDTYLEGPTSGIGREAPVPVVSVESQTHSPGGAANTAVNIRTLGGQVDFISVVGEDLGGEALKMVLEENEVATRNVIAHAGRDTMVKHRIIAESQMLLRFDTGSTGPVAEVVEQRLIDSLEELYPQADAVVVSDYGYGILTPRVVEALARLQERHPRLMVADAKDALTYKHVGVTAMKPNYQEALRILCLDNRRAPSDRVEEIRQYAEEILLVTGSQIVAVTLDTEGALILENGNPPYRTYAHPGPHSRATGAGDTFVSALTLALAAGADTPQAAELASGAAAVVVGKEGTASCFAEELRSYILPESKYLTDRTRLAARIDLLRRQEKSIVFTNGCFDIIHRGHISYLNRAKELGDVLVVGVNSDESTKRLKGPGRPINTLEDRVQVLSALSSVDLIVPFEEDTPVDLIVGIRPDVFVKGADYTIDQLPEAPVVLELGGRVEILPYVEDRSTSSMIQRIRGSCAA